MYAFSARHDASGQPFDMAPAPQRGGAPGLDTSDRVPSSQVATCTKKLHRVATSASMVFPETSLRTIVGDKTKVKLILAKVKAVALKDSPGNKLQCHQCWCVTEGMRVFRLDDMSFCRACYSEVMNTTPQSTV